MDGATTLDSTNPMRRGAARFTAPMIDFARRLIQTPSPSGDERAAAELMAAAMTVIGYDDVWIDRAGNAIGVLRGSGSGPSVQFNSHLDHVAAGDLSLWPVPPFEGRIDGDTLFGRGASDVKGALATQVYLGAVLKDAGLRPEGDVYVVGVVLEEVGGFGSQVIATEMPTDYAVLGEASNNQLRRGHRGRVLLQVTFTGRSAHASAPERARNPHYAAARFLLRIEDLDMVSDATFGGSSVAPTLVGSDQSSANVTPGTVTLYLDWRNVPSESTATILARLAPLLRDVERATTGITASINVVDRPVRSYTGLEAVMPPTRGFETPADDWLVTAARTSLAAALDRPVGVDTWMFATDGGHLSHHGIKTIGFAPGEERFAHTIEDRVSLSQMAEALLGNAALALALTASDHDAHRA